MNEQDFARFRAKIQVGAGCHLWTAAKTRAGYGAFWINGKLQFAHRIAFELAKGAIPDGMFVLHSCDTPACCNPDHLRAGTHAENVADKMNRGRQSRTRGEATRQAKLTEVQVRECYERRGRGESYASIAKSFGVPTNSIYYILSGKRWPHLHPDFSKDVIA